MRGLGVGKDPTSQYRGVCWNKNRLYWEVSMKATGAGKRSIYLGCYVEDEEGAARMYDRGQLAYLGRKAYAEAYLSGRNNAYRGVGNPNFPVEEYSHELDWLEGLGVLDFKARLKAARKKLKKAKKPATPAAVLQEAGLPSVPGPQQQHGATPMEAEDEEIEIRKLAREGTPPRFAGPGRASRPKRSLTQEEDAPAAKRQRPAVAPAPAAAEAAVIQELRRELRVAEMNNKVLVAESAGLTKLNAQLEQFNAHLLEDNRRLRLRLGAAGD